MSDFQEVFNSIKSQVKSLAGESLKEYATQAAEDANSFLDSSKEKLEKWTRQLAAKEITKEEFLWSLNSQQGLAKMKILTQAGLAQIKIDTFTSTVKSIVIDTLLKKFYP